MSSTDKVPKAVLFFGSVYYNLTDAYDVKRSSFQRRVKEDLMGKFDNKVVAVSHMKGHTCIDNVDIMRAKFTPRFSFARAHAMAAGPPPIQIPN